MMTRRSWLNVSLSEVIKHRKEFIQTDDLTTYKRCRVQLHAQGIVLRDSVSGSEIKTKKQQICHTGEFLVAEIDAKVGGFGIVPESLEGAIVSSHYFLFKLDERSLDRRFLDYFIRTRYFRDQVTAQGSTNYAAIRPEDVLGYEIPLPPLDEQHCIVTRIEKLAARIEEARELRRRAVNEIEDLWKSSLNEAYHPKRLEGVNSQETAVNLLKEQAQNYSQVPRENHNNAHPWDPLIESEGLYEIPENWTWTNLGSVLSHLVDCVNDTPNFSSIKTEFLGLKSTNIRPYNLDLSLKWHVTDEDFRNWNRRQRPMPGDVILTREAPMGNTCIIPEGLNVCLTQRLMLLRCNERFILNKYILHFLNSFLFQKQILELCRGLTTPHIRVQDAPKFKIPLAPRTDQYRVVSRLDSIQSKLDAIKRHQAETDAELDVLLPAVLERAFRGEL